MPSPTDLPTHTFPTASAFASFLQTHHTTSRGLYIQHSKKGSGIPSITYTEALELCLCYGWIDGRRNALSATHFLQRYTPRRARSNWSARNVEIVERLVGEDRMREEGLKRVEEARRDGRWGRAYRGAGEMKVPGDLEEALGRVQGAREAFERLGRQRRYELVLRVENGGEETRGRRVEGVVRTLGRKREAETDMVETRAKQPRRAGLRTRV
ncbi:hypothetical protein EJ04DRAFT_539855 [Polyplosphaeria fusca]|uniref:Uncharacterized protein n=1 Tax=Polyplosphaeria fusca TaxID=682080 RepID=A0A9P4R7Y7_9PLEO|nr:hypothetical protein EJ04DRAFT_539855 [Polyplosphaeria fusca]